MIKFKNIVASVLVGAMVFGATGCSMIEKTPEGVKNSPVVKVNGEKITRGQLDQRIDGIIQSMKLQYGEEFDKSEQGKQLIESQKKQELENLITEVVVLQKAKDLKITDDTKKIEDEAKKQYDDVLKGNFGGDKKKFEEALKKNGHTDESYKKFIKDNVIISMVVDKIKKEAKVDDTEVKDEYEKNKDKYTEKPNRIHVGHILVQTEKEAKDIKAKIDKGSKFEDMAKKYGSDATKDKGGDLGWINFEGSGFDQDFMNAAKKVKVGTVSEPVKTQFGYHLIKVYKVEKYPTKPFDKVKDQIKQTLLSQKQNELIQARLKEWKSKAKIKMYEKNIDYVIKK